MEKQCSQCKQIKPISEFRKHGKDNYRSECKDCSRKAYALYSATHPETEQQRERKRAHGIRRYHEHPELWVSYRQTDKEARRKRRLEKLGALLENQSEGCAICGATVSPNNRALAIDHDHHTGMFRGILCQHCNTGLGQFKDDPDLLRKAALYLEEHRERETA